MKNNLLLSVLLTAATLTVLPAKAETKKIEFQGPVRLQKALSAMDEQGLLQNTYWPTARLVKTDEQSELARKKRKTLAELEQLANYWRSRREIEKAEAAELVRSQVATWQLGKQYWGALSFEQARLELAGNPLLPKGDYELVVSERSNFVYAYGLVSEPGQYQFHSGKTLANWLHSIDEKGGLLAGYNKSRVTKVSMSGEVEADWAYFRQDDAELLPGDILWLGFEPNQLPAKFEHLNNDIKDLLSHFVQDDSVRTATNAPLHKVSAEPTSDWHWSRQDLSPSYNDYGSVGLMQNPTARMAKEGEVAISYSDMDEYRRYTVNMQVLPWLEATAFYTRMPNRKYSNVPDFSGDTIYTDKGFDAKVRLWQESYWLPEVSLGFRDFAGTGFFDAEYFVANKRFGPLDFSLGLGFGRIGTHDDVSNPFCEVSDEYCDRKGGYGGSGGTVDYDRWFTGPAAIFAGVEYQTPWEPLSLKAEYEGNDYSTDRAGVPIVADSRWSFGANYQVTDWFDVQLSYERGNTFMFNFSLRTNFNTMNQVKVKQDKTPPQQASSRSMSEVDWQGMSSKMRKQGAFSGAHFYENSDKEVTLFAHHRRYRNSDEAYDRAARIMAAELPESVETYNLVDMTLFDPNVNSKLDVVEFKRRINNEDPGKSVDETAELFSRMDSPDMPANDDESWRLNPDYNFKNSYGLKPFFQQDFGSPENFHTYQLGVYAFGRRWLTDNLEMFGEVGFNLANNYDDFNFLGGGRTQLPEVRTNVRRYVSNDIWLERAQMTYFKRLGQDWFSMAYAGYLERMFGGVGGEILYRPVDSRWAFGLQANRVRQRDFNGGSGFLNYEVTTGFASVYYQMPWLSDTMLQLDFGQFLAGDKGVNVMAHKRFDSGVVVGAFAAFTDVSSEEYGEGSFTKGFFINIPFDLMSVRPTRERVGISWAPLMRNGGQQLHRQTTLYGITDERAPFYHR
ncbi:YjbH domain-containing protein [Idiomarina aminovorans]|uniref:YjbH domain-containing protein n=1 Tax=Idiomarina aminovorans TaxID=2914829 RepID=UPI0020062BDA|nr:YjbH domain-containing protein [Idiomarina sp. ATCH4]MCK7459147.1 YjbH domain-containing protein [Idiomarina sp. ATCH4]